jgi:hypothetical protein
LRRITKAALGGLAGCALALGGTQLASGELLETYRFSRDTLTDLLPDTTDGAFDGAKAKTTISLTDAGGTTITIRVTGIDTSSLPPLPEGGIGAHLHVGPCDDSGGHYEKVDLPPPAVRDNEFWFDLIPDAEGMAYDETTMPFVPIDEGNMSIVIHEKDAQTGGTKQACFPLSVSGIFPEPPTE